MLVRVRLDEIKMLEKNRRVYLNLDKGLEWVGIVKKIEKRNETSYSIFGEIENIPHGQFILTVEGDAVVANIDAAFFNMQFLTHYVRDGIHLLYQIDTDKYAACADNEPGVENWEPEPEESLIPSINGRNDFSPAGDDCGFIEAGVFDFSFNTASEGVNAITNSIDTNLIDFPVLHVKASARAETLTINKRMRIQACGGLVRIGSE